MRSSLAAAGADQRLRRYRRPVFALFYLFAYKCSMPLDIFD